MSTKDADSDSGNGVECPDCGRGGFAGEPGLKVHQSQHCTEAAPPWQNEQLLREMYVEEGKPAAEIGDILSCDDNTILNWLDEYGIETRPSGGEVPDALHDKELLEQLYISEGQSLREVADQLGCSITPVSEWLDRHGIPTHPVGRNLDSHPVSDDGSRLRELYEGREMSTTGIADKFGVARSSVLRWFEWHEIETRAQGGTSGKDSPNWKGGYESYYGPNWHKNRLRVLERDGHSCRRCGMGPDEHEKSYGCGLNVHHIVPHRTFETPTEANRVDNLITLCKECHLKMEGLPIDNRQ